MRFEIWWGVWCFSGALYFNGQGVEKNLTKADQYISKACKLGDQEACEALKEK